MNGASKKTCDNSCDKLTNLKKHLPPEIVVGIYRKLDVNTAFKLNLSNKESWSYLNKGDVYNSNKNYKQTLDSKFLKCHEKIPDDL
uniref:Uncharacterized protein n=1 Tax=viral metagenome TaxID=1070528 RepID=A0A6C0JBW8_9ZZZZ